jgi:hypothetical protein
VVLTDQLALPLTFVSCSASVNGVCGGGGSTRTITFESIPAGGTVTATVVARVNARIRNGVGIANTGTVAHSTADPITSNNTSSTIITVQNSPSVIQMAEPTISYSEGGRVLNVTVYRGGNVFAASTVRYAALDGTATQRADYTMSSGTISFLPGQIAAVVPVIINEDLHVEGSETFRLKLSNPVAAELSEPTETAITLLDNDLVPATTNPLDDAQYYVQQHYYDFMNRLPDQGGWDYWKEQISSCGTDQVCIASRRVGVSAAFFIEAEFQDTGSYVYRMHKATYGQRPLYSDFITDRSRVIGGADLEQGKQAFAIDWVNRPEFLQKYPADLTGAEFVDGLLQTIFHGSGVDLSGKRQALVDDYAANQSRARVLRMVVDDPAFQKAEYNRAFVLMQYFGYLRRDPDPDGYNFWLDIIDNREKGNFRGMVCAFINSPEYQLRFSPVVTRNDKICPVVAAP